MPRSRGRRRSRKARQAAQRLRFLAGLGIVVGLLAAGVVLIERAHPVAVGPAVAERLTSEQGLEETASTDRPVYAYSIIDGGAASVEELKKAIQADPVVAAHFVNFDLANTRLERLTTSKIAHVSYRIGDDVFWTRKPVLLRAGEKILTDGQHIARTRCANQVSDSALVVSALEPPPSALDVPIDHPTPHAGNYPKPVPPGPTHTIPPGWVTGPAPFPPGRTLPPGSGTPVEPSNGPIVTTTPPPDFPPDGDSDGGPGQGGSPPPGPGSPPDPTFPGGPSLPPDTPSDSPVPPPDRPALPPEDSAPPPGLEEPETPPGDDTPDDEPPASTIPEPGTTALLLVGAGAFAIRRFRATWSGCKDHQGV